ncbi:MAG TPA: alpha/beta hydrolase [bacterium]|nr:alpha/beta hydrolase [bacterium]
MKKEKLQIMLIHGGTTFKNRHDYLSFLKNIEVSLRKKIKWSGEYFDKKLGKDFDIIRPTMPLGLNAKYEDWKIYLERFFPLLKDNIVLIGSSLGGIFLAKYLSENSFPKKILSIYLIAAPFDNTLPNEDLVGGFKLKSDLSRLSKLNNLNLLFSENDDVVPVSHSQKYYNKLPSANIKVYKNKNGHFKIKTFPELIKMIENDKINFLKK